MKAKLTNRIFALLLTLVMAFYIVPITAQAATELTTVLVTVTAPMDGEHPNMAVSVGDSTKYYAKNVRWYDDDNLASSSVSTIMSASDRFVEGKVYIIEMTISPKANYTLTVSTIGYINDISAYSGGVNGSGEKLFRAKITASKGIWEVHAEVKAPVAGETASTVANVGSDASGKYYAEVESWRVGGSSFEYTRPMADDEKFVAGETYILLVEFWAKTGFCFADEDTLYATINDESAAHRSSMYKNGKLYRVSYYIVYTIPKEVLEPIPFASATVTKPEPGAHPDYNPKCDSSMYSVSVERWLLIEEGSST